MRKTCKNVCTNISFPFLTDEYQVEECRFTTEYIYPEHSFSTKKMHHHSFFEIHFIESGQVVYRIEEDTIILKKNQYLIIPPRTRHILSETPGCITRYSLSVSFNDLHNERILKSFSNSPYIKGNYDKETQILLQSMASDKSFNDVRKTFMKSIKVYSILNSLPLDIYDFSDRIDEEELIDARLARAKQFIQDNIKFNPTCAQVAKQCYISEKQLTRIFEKHEGITLSKYIMRFKTKKAEQLLADCSLSIRQVSDMLGFTNEFYFNRFFKRNSGMAPGEYRKTLR